jgi:hypothetical protein
MLFENVSAFATCLLYHKGFCLSIPFFKKNKSFLLFFRPLLRALGLTSEEGCDTIIKNTVEGRSTMDVLKRWEALMGHPAQGLSETAPQLVNVRDCGAYSVETYLRRNGKRHGERILLTVPKNCNNAPVAVIPFYFPEA